jgi:hypothetical protein
MTVRDIKHFIQVDPSWAFFLAFVFFGMLSLPLARASLVLSLVFSIVDKNVRTRFRLTPPGLGWLAYFALAVVVSGAMAVANTDWGVAHGLMPAVDPYIEPARGFRKLSKLLWYLAIPVAAVQVRDAGRFRSAFRAWIAGGAVLALSVIFLNPPLAWLQVHCHVGPAWFDKWLSSPVWTPWGGRPPAFQFAFSALGTMHDAQRLMVALIASVCAIAASKGSESRKASVVAVVVAFGRVMTCKRGPLLVGILVSASVLATRVRWWKILALAALVVLAAFIQPQSRARLLDLPNEFTTNQHLLVKRGGRMLMWTRIVPALHAEYPRGMGFRSLTAIKMHNVDWHVERNRTHVHCVPLQAFVDFGWAGPVIWLFWMFLAFRSAIRLKRTGPAAGLAAAEALMPLAALSALVLFGMVEYNLADAAVVPLYSIAMGLPLVAATKAE